MQMRSQPPRRSRLAACLGLLLLVAAVTTPGAVSQGMDFGSMHARPAPAWLSRASIYEIWLPNFSEEGNLRGAIPRLKDVADLGATFVYLGPIAKRSAEPNASPYSIADYNTIDPEAGNDQDLHDFVNAAHALHLRVMLDIVYYHVAPDDPMVKSDPAMFQKTADGTVARGFWPQPLPDFRNPKTREYLIASLVHWVRDFDVDGFRCDVGAGVPVSFWNEARKALDASKPDVILLSESDRPDDQLRAFDINYNFQWYLAMRSVVRDGAPATHLRESWQTMRAGMPQGARLMRYTDNHDWPRAVLQFGEKGALAASIVNFTLDGIPFLYNGQEVQDPLPTSWRKTRPIRWPSTTGASGAAAREVLAKYKALFRLRSSEPAISSPNVTWVNNSEPDSVVSYLRETEGSRVLVMVNLSNRNVHVTLDLPVMDSFKVTNLLDPGDTWFQLYSGRVSSDLAAFGYVVGRIDPKLALGQSAEND